MTNVKEAKAHVKAKNNISKTWKILLDKAQVHDRNQRLNNNILEDPTHPVVGVINWTYSSEGFCYKVLNHSSRVKNKDKIPTMGPYAYALGRIVKYAHKKRIDINPSDFSRCEYFRGSGLTEQQIEKYR